MFQLNKMKNNMSTILGPEVEIKGDVIVAGDLLINGKVDSSLFNASLLIHKHLLKSCSTLFEKIKLKKKAITIAP